MIALVDALQLIRTGLTVLAAATVAYLAHAYVRFYIFRRKEQLENERFPFENTLTLFNEKDRILELCKEYADAIKSKYGRKTYVLQVLGLAPFVMTNDVENVTYILKTNYENFGKSGGSFKPKMQGLLGNGIFNADGSQWYIHRKTSAHLFKLSQFKTCVLDTFNHHLGTLIKVLHAKRHAPLDLQDLFHKLTLDSIAFIAFGVELNTLERDRVDFAADFDYCTQCVNDYFTNPLWRVEKYLTVRGWRYFAALRRINKFAGQLIAQRRELIAKEGALRSGRVDLLSLYLDKDSFEEMGDKGLYMEPSEANLRDVILNMVIAGRDTTAQALSWAFFHLCIHPEMQARAREEVVATLVAALVEGQSESSPVTRQEALAKIRQDAELPARLLTYNAAQKLRYVEAFCMETLRLHPSVPKEAKTVMKDDTLPDGTAVFQGDIVSFQPWVMGRDADIWGPDCEEFKPERFLDQPKRSPFEFIAFQVTNAAFLSCSPSIHDCTLASLRELRD